MAETRRSSFDRRSGIERRCVSYAVHIPERRSGTDRRVSDERRKELIRTSSGLKLLKELYGSDWHFED